MRRRIALLLLLPFLLVGCTDYTQAGKHEMPLDVAYEAMGSEAYPLTRPVIVGCDYYRIPGEKERRPLGELALYMKDTSSLEWITGAQEWSERMCASSSDA